MALHTNTQSPPTPINKLPDGLLGFLGIKNGGQAPAALPPILSPTIDLTGWYLRSYLTRAKLTAGPPAVGSISQVGVTAVPAGETWYVHRFSASVNIPAGDAIRFSIGLSQAQGFAPDDYESLAVNQTSTGLTGSAALEWTVASCGDFWLRPGEQLAIMTLAKTGAGAPTLRTFVNYVSLPF